MTTMNATYSPDDNKLRLYASSRLDQETFARVKAAGFKWAPKQDLFVAPMWTPDREDLLTDLCGEIGDEDTSLCDRAEDRAERFEVYSDKRKAEAERARKAVADIADNIPLGQPILVGHHSERHARRDAEKIENGMRKTVKLWRTSQYWTARAEGAIRHAKYKERPEVRARRIKTIEADKRKAERDKQKSEMWLHLWTECGNETDTDLQHKVALRLANMCWLHLPRKEGDKPDWQYTPTAYDALSNSSPSLYAPRTLVEIVDHAKVAYPRFIACSDRWIAHYENRLAYEKAMLEEAGASDLLKPKPRRELVPLLNYRAEAGSITTENMYDRGRTITYQQIDMTKADYAKINQDYKGARVGADRQHRFRTAMVKHSLVAVFLTDSKEHPRPTAPAVPSAPRAPVALTGYAAPRPAEDNSGFAEIETALKSGVQVVVAPQLFPTPADLAAEMVEIAGIEPEHRVLEPSAGTGAILQAIGPGPDKVAVEIDPRLIGHLALISSGLYIHHADFLECNGDLGTFDRILMNPPFERGADIEHIEHARKFLKPGGRLVAICANGPRQQARLAPLATFWRVLPEGTFKQQGTMVSTVLLVIEA
jgi:protein-L-isoaspartate O-methyltransferase